MGATFYYNPLRRGKPLPVNAPSSFREAFEEAFGSLPVILSASHIPTLNGLRAAMKHEREAFDRILAAIEEHDSIEIQVEY